MLEKDSIILGVIVGIILPFVGYAVFLMLYEQLESAGIINSHGFSPSFRQRTISLLAICLNLIPFIMWKGRYGYNTMRGIIFPTVAYVMVWLFYFSSVLFVS